MFEEFDVNAAEIMFVVVSVFEITRLVARVVSGSIPNAIFEAFRLLRMFPVTRPVTLANVILEIVLPWMSAEFTIPNARFDAFRLLSVFVLKSDTLANAILESVLP